MRKRRKEKINKSDIGEGVVFKVKTFLSDRLYNLSVRSHNFFKRFGKGEKPVEKRSENELKKIKHRNRTKELLCIWSVLIIPLINLFIFWVIGTINSIPIAFEYYPADAEKIYNLYNFKYIFDAIKEPGSIFMNAFTNTLKYWAVGWFFLMPFSYLISFFLYKRIPGYRIFRYIFYMPSILSAIIVSSVFMYLVAPGGVVAKLAEDVFGVKGLMLLETSETAFPTLIFYMCYTGLNGNMLYWLASFARIPQEIIEAGKLDGLSFFGEFWYIAFPITKGFFATFMMLALTGILTAGGPALLLTDGNYGTYDLGFFEYKMTVSGTPQSQAIGGAVGLLKGIIILPIALIVNRLVMKIDTVEI